MSEHQSHKRTQSHHPSKRSNSVSSISSHVTSNISFSNNSGSVSSISNATSTITTTVAPVTGKINNEMKGLLEHQAEIQKWLTEVNRRLYDLEGQYLEDTPFGNIIRGWDNQDPSRGLTLRRGFEEKERLFSHSSYKIWLEGGRGEREGGRGDVGEKQGHQQKKRKRGPSTSVVKDDANEDEDDMLQ